MEDSIDKEKSSIDLRLSKIENRLDELQKIISGTVQEERATKEDIETYKSVLRAAKEIFGGIYVSTACHCDDDKLIRYAPFLPAGEPRFRPRRRQIDFESLGY
jgi:hypothetical protein